MSQRDKITSRDNSRLSHARKVRDGKISGEIFLEGLRLVEEALRSDVTLKECFYTERFAESLRASDVLDRISSAGVPAHQISESLFDSIADTKTSQGIAVTAARPETGRGQMPDVENGLFIYLSEVNDPANLGAVFRTAEAAGVDGLILSSGSADTFSPKALRASMGSNLRIPVWEKTEFQSVLGFVREKGLRTVAADLSGTIGHPDIDWREASLIVFGSEAHGLTEEVLREMNAIFQIPMKNGVESLNLAVSAGIVLFEAVRQRDI